MELLDFFKHPLVTTILGGVAGLLIKTLIDVFKQRHLQQQQAQMQRLEKQLSEFYWPLYAGLVYDEAIWKLRPLTEDLNDEERKQIQEKIESDLLLPNHEAMAQIISSKLQLAGYAKVPEIYEEYLRHVAAFKGLRASGSQEAPSSIGAPWPEGFTEQIQKRTVELTQQHAALIDVVLEK